MPKPTKDVVLSKKDLGARLRAIRQARGLTQDEVARAIGTHFTSISAVERGVRGLTIQQIVKLATALKVSPDELLHPKKAAPPKATGRRDGRLMRRLERIRELPPAQQRTVLDVLDSLLKTHGQTQSSRTR
jgi:transcriptional regulator with XRE-family HTH domain